MQGKKTPIEVREKVILCRASGMGWTEIAEKCNIPDATAYKIVTKYLADEKNVEEFKKLEEQQKKIREEATKKFNESMIATFEELFTKSARVVNKALDEGTITTKEALTTIGITFDKRQIATGKSTQNINLNFEDLLEKINEGNEY